MSVGREASSGIGPFGGHPRGRWLYICTGEMSGESSGRETQAKMRLCRDIRENAVCLADLEMCQCMNNGVTSNPAKSRGPPLHFVSGLQSPPIMEAIYTSPVVEYTYSSNLQK